ncbi:MAG: gamma-glutamyl-gamma-aminobutyrate hydrolase family protein [Kiloniellales bacterium]|nr:gamma-glutamyl-gamma-aminobutyrate hydrolase family protein [Kiloniellales bacterium]
MSDAALQPLIGVPADVKPIEDKPFHAVGDKYVRAVLTASHGLPLIVPAFGDLYDIPALVERLDGLLLTGSPSNVHPTHYDTAPTPEAEPHDPERDDTTLPLIREALAQAVPLLAICRGFQELNVALGGTLHARVHELPGRDDHRRPQHEDPDVQYGPRHSVALTPGGAFARLAGAEEITVNSLHWQALDRVADTLTVEGTAPDGTIEAVSVHGARDFALGVQWHPEYKVGENPFSAKLFAAFGSAARSRAAARRAGRLPRREVAAPVTFVAG